MCEKERGPGEEGTWLRGEAMLAQRQPGGSRDPGLLPVEFSSVQLSSAPTRFSVLLLEIQGQTRQGPGLQAAPLSLGFTY